MEILLGIMIGILMILSFIGGYVFRVKTAQPMVINNQNRPLSTKKRVTVDYKHPIRGRTEETEDKAGYEKFKTGDLFEPQVVARKKGEK